MTIEKMTEEEIDRRARLGYEAWCTFLNVVPAWHELSEGAHDAWIQVARAILRTEGA